MMSVFVLLFDGNCVIQVYGNFGGNALNGSAEFRLLSVLMNGLQTFVATSLLLCSGM